MTKQTFFWLIGQNVLSQERTTPKRPWLKRSCIAWMIMIYFFKLNLYYSLNSCIIIVFQTSIRAPVWHLSLAVEVFLLNLQRINSASSHADWHWRQSGNNLTYVVICWQWKCLLNLQGINSASSHVEWRCGQSDVCRDLLAVEVFLLNLQHINSASSHVEWHWGQSDVCRDLLAVEVSVESTTYKQCIISCRMTLWTIWRLSWSAGRGSVLVESTTYKQCIISCRLTLGTIQRMSWSVGSGSVLVQSTTYKQFIISCRLTLGTHRYALPAVNISSDAYKQSCWREVVQMWYMWGRIYPNSTLQSAYAHSHWGKTIQMWDMWSQFSK